MLIGLSLGSFVRSTRLGASIVFASLTVSGAALAADGWASDPRNGCRLWLLNLQPGHSVRWEGACVGGYASGRGRFTVMLNGAVSSQGEADFQNGKRNGRGFVVTPEGGRTEGEYVDGKLNGRVIMMWPDGQRYDGQMRNNLREGRGVLVAADGDRYDGDWKAGQADGLGIYSWKDGRRYEGEWKAGLSDGRGKMSWPDGTWYEGEWRKDRPNGQGVYHGTAVSGVTGNWSGVWRDGCYSMNGSRAAITRTNAECGF